MSTDAAMRGRVMAIYMAIALGGTLVGAPFVGWVADAFGPRWSLGVGAVAGILAMLIGLRYMFKYRALAVKLVQYRVQFSLDGHEVQLREQRRRQARIQTR